MLRFGAEESPVAAPHHADSGADETDGRVADRRRLPAFCSNACLAEEHFSDGTVARSGLATVERAQTCQQALGLLLAWGRGTPGRSTMGKSPETESGLGASRRTPI